MSVAESLPTRGDGLRIRHPAVLVALLFAAAAALAWRDLSMRFPESVLLAVLAGPDAGNIDMLLLHYSVLPRMAVVLMGGAALALAGTVCQQVMRNPLAEPTTLGVSAGAHLALTAAALWAPSLLAFGREWVAMAGAVAAILCVFGLAWSRALSPLSLVLAGLVVSLYCGAFGSTLVLLNHDYMTGLFIWGAGFLTQQDWSVAAFLAPRLGIAALLVVLMRRPLTVLGLDDDAARNLGLGLSGARLAALALAVVLSASVVSGVGMLGFVGLAAPALVALAGARRFTDRLLWAPLCGAGLLWLTDELVLMIPQGYREIPTGAATALLGAPILLWLLPRLRTATLVDGRVVAAPSRCKRPLRLIAGWMIVLLASVWVALAVGQGTDGWEWVGVHGISELLPWRAPRVLAALAAGVMLAMAGVLLQRLTGNPMAAPEVLGISAGAAMAVILLLFLVPGPTRPLQIAAGGGGALAVLAVILLLGRKAAFSPDRLLLAGVATSAVFGAIVAVAMSTGDPRMAGVLSWMAGSTYQVEPAETAVLCTVAAVLLATAPLLARWLEILPLGAGTAQALGVSVAASRSVIMLVTAVLTAAATLLVGPLSFVGLMAPHMARMMGLHRALHHVLGAAVMGGVVMVFADWAGRTVIFPFQVPAGLLATVVGGPYLMWLLRSRR